MPVIGGGSGSGGGGNGSWLQIFPMSAINATVTQGTWAALVNASDIYNGAFFNSTQAQNDEYSFKFSCDNGTYTITLWYTKSTAGGIVTPSIDASALSTIDTFNGSTLNNQATSYTNQALSGGSHTFDFKVASKNASSTNFQWHHIATVIQRTA